MTDERGELYQKKFEEKVLKESEVPEFHAQPLPISEPFIPKRSEKQLTETHEFNLKSEIRLQERKAFEEELTKRKREEEEELQKMQQIQKVFTKANGRKMNVKKLIVCEKNLSIKRNLYVILNLWPYNLREKSSQNQKLQNLQNENQAISFYLKIWANHKIYWLNCCNDFFCFSQCGNHFFAVYPLVHYKF